MKKLLYFISIVFILSSCDALTGKEIARIPVNALSQDSNLVIKETSLDLKKGDELKFWSDMDISYEGDAKLLFQVEIWNNDKRLGVLEFNPMEKNISMNEIKTEFNGKTEWEFEGKNAEYKIEEDGKYLFKAALFTDNRSLQVDKAEIFIKK